MTITFTAGTSGYTAPSRVLASLVKNGDGSFTLTRRDRSQLVFSAGGQLATETDRNGYTTTLAYQNSRLATVTDQAGRSLSFAYGTNGLLSQVTDAVNRTVSFAYDGGGNLTSATDVAGGVTSFTYDPGHQMLTMTDPRGGVLTNTYDSQDMGRVTSQTDSLNRNTVLSYSSGQTTETDPRGLVTVYRYQSDELASVTAARSPRRRRRGATRTTRSPSA